MLADDFIFSIDRSPRRVLFHFSLSPIRSILPKNNIHVMTLTIPEDFKEAFHILSNTFKSNKTKSLAWRKWQLKQCWWMVSENEAAILQTLVNDLHLHDYERQLSDVENLKSNILENIKQLEDWTADQRAPSARLIQKLRIRSEPLGVALVIGTSFTLLIQPLLAAITAGCCVFLKPLETISTSENLLC